MDNSLIEKYKAEMLKMHRLAKSTPPAQTTATPETPPVTTMPPLSERTENTTEFPTVSPEDEEGYLIAIITSLRSLYPVPNATVTIFTGDMDNMNTIAVGRTDQSGRTETFTLPAPKAGLSQASGSVTKPYAEYNMLVKAEGYTDNIHLNVPVFSGVTSLQRSDMMLLETAGIDKGPRIFNESEQYNL